MASAEDILTKLSGETKALILANEYKIGHADLSRLNELLDIFVSSDLERIGILELIRRIGMRLGMTQDQANVLSDALAGVGTLPPAAVDPFMSQHGDKTVRIRRFDLPVSDTPTAKHTEPQTFKVRPIETMKLRKEYTPQTSATIPSQPSAANTSKPAAASSGTFYGGGTGGMFSSQALAKLGERRVLLADDDARIRMVFSKKLEESGYLVEEVGDGQTAWDKLQSNTYCLAILDMKMPGLHGLELLARLTAAGSKTPVIICSAYEQLKEEFVVSTYPHLRYLVKPVPIEKLLQAAGELVPSQ